MMHNPSPDRVRWRSASPADILWILWSDSFIAYHRPSGKTHFLNASSHYLITELLREPSDAETICRAFEIGGDDPRQTELEDLLGHLDELGLVDRV